jgi:hypothetical protein
LELFGVGDGVAELAVLVEATGEEVVEQAGAHLPQLRNHRLRLRYRLVHRIQHQSDAHLVFRVRNNNPHLLDIRQIESRLR